MAQLEGPIGAHGRDHNAAHHERVDWDGERAAEAERLDGEVAAADE
jgi:hypothetical protein